MEYVEDPNQNEPRWTLAFTWDPDAGDINGRQNPFNLEVKPSIFKKTSSISFTLLSQTNVSLKIYNSSGRLVKTLHNGPNLTGIQKFVWDGKGDNGRKIPYGIYIVNFTAANIITNKQILLIR